jgi:hypothetical protein
MSGESGSTLSGVEREGQAVMPGTPARFAVKVINDHGDVVMRVFEL